MAHKEKMIGGYEEYEVKSCYDTLIRAREILDDTKKVVAVKIYAKKAAEAAVEVAVQLDLEKTVGKKIKEVFGDKHNPGNTHKKGGGSY